MVKAMEFPEVRKEDFPGIEDRDTLIFGYCDLARYGEHGGNAPRFNPIDIGTVKALVDKGFLSLQESQNGGPTTEDFMEFMEKHPEAKVAGYAIARMGGRDYRITLEEIAMSSKSFAAVVDFANSFHGADEFEMQVLEDGSCACYAWWD